MRFCEFTGITSHHHASYTYIWLLKLANRVPKKNRTSTSHNSQDYMVYITKIISHHHYMLYMEIPGKHVLDEIASFYNILLPPYAWKCLLLPRTGRKDIWRVQYNHHVSFVRGGWPDEKLPFRCNDPFTGSPLTVGDGWWTLRRVVSSLFLLSLSFIYLSFWSSSRLLWTRKASVAGDSSNLTQDVCGFRSDRGVEME
jgi:hypothetical protein